MKKSIITAAVILLIAFGAAPAFAAGRQQADATGPAPHTLEVTGSTSVAPLMEAIADAYRSVNPALTINVSGTGSGDGITGANTGVAEVGMSSRGLRPAELGFGLDVLTVAIDAIAVVVHPSNPVTDLTLEQINGIYTGKITNWSQVGGRNNPIAVVSREPGSGTRGAFEEIVDFRDQLVAGAVEFDGTGGVRASVAGNPNAIGYISLGSVTPEVSPVRVDGVEATVANVQNGSFPVTRPFLLMFREENVNPATMEFLEWATSSSTQRDIVAARGYVPIN